MTDLLLKGGEVIDPSPGIRDQLDVAVSDGKISQLAPDVAPGPDTRVIDVTGKIVVPGLIDLHCHIYHGVNQTGVNPDLAGVYSGVTTLVDAGSAGCYTFGGFPEHVVPKAITRIICMLHISRTGLAYQPDLSRREDIDLEDTIRVVRENRPLIQGIKIRAVGPAVPVMGVEIVQLAKQAANEAGVRLMVHIGDRLAGDGPTITRALLPLLEPGDIITHLFTGNPGTIFDDDGSVLPELMAAQERGVFLDTAHGRQNFSFDIARRALDRGVVPRGISTDLTIPGRLHAVHSMTEMLSRFLALGFSLEDVIRMSTANPAEALGMGDTLGTLAVGRGADITVLEEATGDWLFHDTEGGTLRGDKALAPVATVKDGEVFTADWGPRPWGWLPDTA
ncbi:MAG: amidohydrolase/deacetylase family metallohydrolase [SAR202 cluster bacterium]|jgi:dihydroorotase|nr:amidohydrolase/deacetylase family metallohydrolase [SAR202 cluster bacterium]HAL47304.1 amidohydrolase/deacetylase family metallohydrolase [Dehalococcoidia bacterium]MDP6664179.1 amidohydrolase/deacetylase family metallohydrolase [SAR202 cluster bacterium]MDP6799073.1 amidohydrolase/deacetylase family metallohydrolase [SAR202 cluster bacterium]MQG58205.1 amidohydrolase/deacetylase family metallohydrolase [SAR202 cluster bacterium]|tara:strand:+ start:25070 stop:26245 length:1176 start_codon:yes stop_codon:yes gene_type:complete